MAQAVIELSLVPHATLNEQAGTVIEREELGDPVLDPQELAPAALARGSNPPGPSRVVGIDDSIAPPSQLGERRRLAGARHPGDEDPPH